MKASLSNRVQKATPWFVQDDSSMRTGWLRHRARGWDVDVRRLGQENRENAWHSSEPLIVTVEVQRGRLFDSLLEVEHWAQRPVPTLVTASVDTELADLHLLLLEAGAQDVIVGWEEPRRALKLLSRFVERHRVPPRDVWSLVASRLRGGFR